MYSQQDFDQAVQKGIDERVAKLNRENSQKKNETTVTVKSTGAENRVQLAANRAQPRRARIDARRARTVVGGSSFDSRQR